MIIDLDVIEMYEDLGYLPYGLYKYANIDLEEFIEEIIYKTISLDLNDLVEEDKLYELDNVPEVSDYEDEYDESSGDGELRFLFKLPLGENNIETIRVTLLYDYDEYLDKKTVYRTNVEFY